MLPSLLSHYAELGHHGSPSAFSNRFYRISPSDLIEEETLPGYVPAHYYPTLIGEIIQNRYQVVGKLRFEACSSVWFARDMR